MTEPAARGEAIGELPDTLRLVCVKCCCFRRFVKSGDPYVAAEGLWQTYECSQCRTTVSLETI